MRKSLNNFQIVTRWILIVGVMSGLFFSSGEGIQLLPFSAASGAGTKNASKLETGKSKSYSYSVRNAAAQSAAIKSNQQKDPKSIDFAGIDYSGSEHRLPEFSGAPRTPDYRQPVHFKFSPVTAAPSDRAPPAV